MIKAEYYIGKKLVETFYRPNLALINWHVKNLKKTTHKIGTFKIKKT